MTEGECKLFLLNIYAVVSKCINSGLINKYAFFMECILYIKIVVYKLNVIMQLCISYLSGLYMQTVVNELNINMQLFVCTAYADCL